MFLKKTYIVFDTRGVASRDAKGVKGLRKAADGTTLGKKKGVFFKFSKNRVVGFGAIGEGLEFSYAEADKSVSDVVGIRVRGKVVVQVYHLKLPSISSKVQLALLHNRIAATPPKGLVTSTLDYQVSDKLVVKISPYQDKFALTFRLDCNGSIEVICDARACRYSVCSEVFRRRCVAVLAMINI